MSNEEMRLRRLNESAEDLGRHIASPGNFPIEEHINVTELEGLRDTFGVDPDSITADDLTRIILVRDALYTAVEQVTEMDENGRHSVTQLLNTLNRLYVDAEAYLKAKNALIEAAEKSLEEQRHTRPIQLSPTGAVGQTIINVSNEVINNVSVTNKHININILNGVNLNVMKNLRVQIRRLSASAFVVNVKVNARVMFEGTVQFLTATADRVLSDLRTMAESLKESFGSAEAIVKSLDSVIKSGTKFVKVVGALIQDAMNDDGEVTEVKLTLRNATSSKAVTAGVSLANGGAALFIRGGGATIISANGPVTNQATDAPGPVNSVAELSDGRIVMATGNGPAVWTPRFKGGGTNTSRERDSVFAVAAQNYEGVEAAITANSFGELDRWWFPGGRPAYYGETDALYKLQEQRRHRRDRLPRVRSIIPIDGRVIVARENGVSIYDDDLNDYREIPFVQPIGAMCKLNHAELVVVGDALVAVVDTAHGNPVRLLPVPGDASYISVVPLNEHVIAVCNAKGRVVAIDVRSGAELGELDTAMETRGLVIAGKMLIAYGGGWNTVSRSIAYILWEEMAPTPIS
ncbi:YncE family protein [Neoaquamicrobium sediminum]|uniref:YncE family protein n=1 Tax=Neoaquamicrobium sediminum TaxID=1849104 RepID=UPI003BABCBB1